MAKKMPGQIDPRNLEDIAKKAKELGKRFDVPPISLGKGGYVKGAISFGSLAIDLVTGGGAPPGRITTVSGPSGSGKSTLTYQASAFSNEYGIPVFYLDHEASADANYLTALGVRLFDDDGDGNPLFQYAQPTGGEDTYRFIHQMIDALPAANTSTFGLPQAVFIIDSLAAMYPDALDEDPEKSSMAGPAKVHSQYFPIIKAHLSRKNCSLIATNQIRQKPGISYGNPEYEPGGQSVIFYPDLKLQVRASGKAENERGRDLRTTSVYTAKNKAFPPFRKIEKDMLKIAFGYGFDRFYDGLTFLKLTDQVELVKGRGGGWKIKGLPGHKLHGKIVPITDLIVESFKDDFRETLRDQMLAGDAFQRYFTSQKMSDLYKFDPENSGIGSGGLSDAEADALTDAANDVASVTDQLHIAIGGVSMDD